MTQGEKIKTQRLQRGLTQAALSSLAGVTIRTIQRIENNEVVPSLHSLKQIGDVLKFDLLDQGQMEPPNNPKELLLIKITDMNQLLTDLKTLFKNHWRLLLAIALVFWLSSNYLDIKQAVADAGAEINPQQFFNKFQTPNGCPGANFATPCRKH